MALVPLKQWYCDRCGRLIDDPEQGWVHWRCDDDRNVFDIEILHHLTASPRGGQRGCYPVHLDSDMPLTAMLGPRGIVELLSMVDAGAYHDPDGRNVGKVTDLRNWTEVFRRLHLPYYEEARRYFDQARHEGDLEGMSEVALYAEDTLRRLVDEYGDGS